MAIFRVVFDSEAGTFQPGETVSGHVCMELKKTVTLRGIELLFRGYSSVKWIVRKTERDENGKQYTVQIPYESDELYYYSKFFVYGNAYSGNTFHAGEYRFNFSMKLPCYFPSSYEGEYGFVRHEVTVMTFPKIGNIPATFPMQIMNYIDFSLKPALEIPVRVVEEKILCSWCCTSGPLTCSLYIPARGFYTGQEIPMTVIIDNLSNTSILGVTIVLQRVDTFVAIQPEKVTKKSIQNLVVLQLDSLPRRSKKQWSRNIFLPNGPASGLKYCAIISLEYFVCVNVILPLPHKNMVAIKTPIIVGNNSLNIIAQESASSVPPSADAMNETCPSSSPLLRCSCRNNSLKIIAQESASSVPLSADAINETCPSASPLLQCSCRNNSLKIIAQESASSVPPSADAINETCPSASPLLRCSCTRTDTIIE